VLDSYTTDPGLRSLWSFLSTAGGGATSQGSPAMPCASTVPEAWRWPLAEQGWHGSCSAGAGVLWVGRGEQGCRMDGRAGWEGWGWAEVRPRWEWRERRGVRDMVGKANGGPGFSHHTTHGAAELLALFPRQYYCGG